MAQEMTITLIPSVVTERRTLRVTPGRSYEAEGFAFWGPHPGARLLSVIIGGEDFLSEPVPLALLEVPGQFYDLEPKLGPMADGHRALPKGDWGDFAFSPMDLGGERQAGEAVVIEVEGGFEYGVLVARMPQL
jgi:hypothetical protein